MSISRGFKGFNALQMRGDILELVALSLVPDNLIEVVQRLRGTLIVQRLVIARQNRQATIAVFLAKIVHTFGGDIDSTLPGGRFSLPCFHSGTG